MVLDVFDQGVKQRVAEYARELADRIEPNDNVVSVEDGLTPDLSRDELEAVRDKKISEQVDYLYEESDFYEEKLDDAGIEPDEITSVDDLSKLPPTTGDELAQASIEFPDYEFAAADWDDLYRPMESSGTGPGPKKQQIITRDDAEAIAEEWVQGYREAGVDEEDRFLMALPYGMNASGFSVHEGVDTSGGLEIPVGFMSPPEEHASLVDDYEPTVLWTLNSYAARFANVMEKEGMDPEESSIEHVFVGGESFSDAELEHLEDAYDADVAQFYAMTEANGPVAIETERGNGLHVLEDSYIVEIVDPETYEPVEDGEEGEVLITPLDREGTPLLRYAPGDLASFKEGGDDLDSVYKRIETPHRKSEVSDIEGVEIYPTMVAEELFDIEDDLIEEYGLNEQFRIEIDKNENEEKHYVDILVEAKEQDDVVEKAMEESLSSVLEFESIQRQDVAEISVETVPLGELATEGKREDIIDHRD